MRFYILSDLHLRAEVEENKSSDRIRKLCAKIRTSTSFDEIILFIILGDIVNKGEELSFETAQSTLYLIVDELNDYSVKFEFVPGNHDIEKGTLCLFDQLTSKFGNSHSFDSYSVYSNVYEEVNFIFADSTIPRDYAAQGRLDIEAIKEKCKPGLKNILFCHHALSHGHGALHDTIEDSANVFKQLKQIGISFLFHGHVHEANITIPKSGLVEVGCGSLSGDISWLKSVFHQFSVGYIQDGSVVLVERWLDSGDGHGGFAVEALYPKPKTFADPDYIGKISYEPVNDYIPRCVSIYEEANKSFLERLLTDNRKIDLSTAVQKHKCVLLLCDAGMGKSTELKNLAYELSSKFHTFFYSLENYCGEDIQMMLPDSYKQLPPNRIALLLDGYDELDTNLAKKLRIKIKQYIQDATGVNIVISSRSNFCGNENSNESRTFSGFNVYVLEPLTEDNIETYLKSKEIDITKFLKCACDKEVSDLLFNPFYLLRLSDIYVKEKNLPPKKQLMDKIIADTFDVDEFKFSGDLDDRYSELFSSLEILAIAMQLMHKHSFNDREQYQVLLSFSERELMKKCGLIKRENDSWKFSHNNFREFLAAKFLARIPKDFVISIIYDGENIRPYWVNTLGYLTGFDLEWELIDWLIEKAPAALVKFEPDRLDEELRIDIFKRLFEKYESLHLHFNDDLCDENELAHFVNSYDILCYLLDRISNPRHYVSQYTALNILRVYPSLFGKENDVREILLECCEQYPATHKSICRLAILALCQLKIQTDETTHQLMEKFSDVDEDYIRLGMYEYLFETDECNSYVKYCLSGIKYITYGLNDGENRIGNETFELINCLKSMSTAESVTHILKWFSQEKHPDFYDADGVLEAAIVSASSLYKEGHKELFDTIMNFYLDSAKVWNTTASNAMVKFFVATGTQYCAAVLAAIQFENEPQHMADLVQADPTVIEYLKNRYLDESFKPHRAFHEIVLWYVRDEKKYVEYAELIRKIDGVELPMYKAPIDYDALKRKSAQEYFEALFDEEKMKKLINHFLEVIDNPDITTKQLLNANIQVEHHSVLYRLMVSMYHYGNDVKVRDFFNKSDMNEFIIRTASSLVSQQPIIIPTQSQKEQLIKIVTTMLNIRSFEDSIVYYPNGFSIKPLTKELLTIIQYLDYPLDEKVLLDLTELPAYIFDKNNEQNKYKYLTSKLSAEKLKTRLVQNVATQRVNSMVLKDHIEFFDKNKDDCLAEYALKLCDDSGDIYLRSIAWQYLYNNLGAEYIADAILPIADEELLIEIAGACKDISKAKLCVAMEREYKKKPSMQLQAYLITYGNISAINDYVKSVSSKKHPPEIGEISIDGPTSAIGSICNPEFLPQLKVLLWTIFDPDFEDCTWQGLRGALMKAFVNCGTCAYKETKELLLKYRPSAEDHEENYMYCNYIIEDIERTRKSIIDVPMSLYETKEILDKVKGGFYDCM